MFFKPSILTQVQVFQARDVLVKESSEYLWALFCKLLSSQTEKIKVEEWWSKLDNLCGHVAEFLLLYLQNATSRQTNHAGYFKFEEVRTGTDKSFRATIFKNRTFSEVFECELLEALLGCSKVDEVFGDFRCCEKIFNINLFYSIVTNLCKRDVADSVTIPIVGHTLKMNNVIVDRNFSSHLM